MAWEKTVLDLAARAGIATPRAMTRSIDARTVLLLERFDRRDGRRVGYLSAMTLLGSHGGRSDHDYLDLADALSEVSSQADQDLAELWRRAAFSVAVHNTDDHLRNHGLLRTRGGWRLSPPFDVNPNPDPAEGRATSIAGARYPAEELSGLLLCAPAFGLSEGSARRVLHEVFDATSSWRSCARDNGAPAHEIARFEHAFEGLDPTVL